MSNLSIRNRHMLSRETGEKENEDVLEAEFDTYRVYKCYFMHRKKFHLAQSNIISYYCILLKDGCAVRNWAHALPHPQRNSGTV